MDFSHIKMTAKPVASRNAAFENIPHVNWEITLNGGKPFNYSEGIGHFINTNHHLYNSLIMENYFNDFLTAKPVIHKFGGVTLKEMMSYFKSDRVEHGTKEGGVSSTVVFKPKAPKIEDVLYSLTMDADAIHYDFEDWCDNYGYSSDSIKAKETFDACRDTAARLMQLGFNLQEMQEHFQDY